MPTKTHETFSLSLVLEKHPTGCSGLPAALSFLPFHAITRLAKTHHLTYSMPPLTPGMMRYRPLKLQRRFPALKAHLKKKRFASLKRGRLYAEWEKQHPTLKLSGNRFQCHEEPIYLQPVIPPKCFAIFTLDWGCSEVLDAFRFFF